MYSPVVFIAIFSVAFLRTVYGHGMMMDPVSRASRWRRGFSGPKEYTDNQLSCGGRNVQWAKHKGKCGVCGDEYGIASPKFEYPGAFARNPPIIVKTYTEGERIRVKVKITANHLGYFTFRLAPVVNQPITQSELNQIMLRMPNGNAEWKLPPTNGMHTITLDLPQGMTCEHCVIQWWWSTGNNHVNDKPETFVNCADIKILPRGGGGKPRPTQPPRPTEPPRPTRPTRRPKPTRQPPTRPPRPTRPEGKVCSSLQGGAAMDSWCKRNCAVGYCPESHCKCE